MNKKILQLISIAFVMALLLTAVFYSLFAGRLNATAVPLGNLRAGPEGVPSVPEGMRAVSVHVSDSSGVVALLKPGYKVDVQMFASQPPKALKEEMTTLLRGVPVLSVNLQPEPSSQGYFSGPVVTLIASAADAQQLAWADSYSRLRMTLRNAKEPLEVVPTVLKLRVTAIVLTDEGFSKLTASVGPDLKAGGINVIKLNSSLSDWPDSKSWSRVESESLVAASDGGTVIFDMPGNGRRVRLSLSPLDRGRSVRIRPEVTGFWHGHLETRSTQAEVDVNSGRPILISGLDDEGKRTDRFCHLALLVVRQAQP